MTIDRCGATGKQRWDTRDQARAGLRAFAFAKGSRKVHRCAFCDGYHLTKGQRGRPGKGK